MQASLFDHTLAPCQLPAGVHLVATQSCRQMLLSLLLVSDYGLHLGKDDVIRSPAFFHVAGFIVINPNITTHRYTTTSTAQQHDK